MVKNEQDLIEPFVRHALRFVDNLIVVDNGSVDDTRPILVKLARELAGLVYADRPDFSFKQSQFMTQLMRFSQSAFFADFIFFLDADEFISAPDRAQLEKILGAIPRGGFGLMPWSTFILSPQSASDEGRDPPRSMTMRRRKESPLYHKAILRADGQDVSGIMIEDGNHSISRVDGGGLKSCSLDSLPLYHFPVRSLEQLASKSIVGWMATLKKYKGLDPPKNHNYQWKMNYRRIRDGDLSAELAVEASWQYAQNLRRPFEWPQDAEHFDHKINYTRKYSNGGFRRPLQMVAASWENSLRKPPPPLAFQRPAQLKSASVPQYMTSFSDDWHWENLYVDVPPFRYLAEVLAPKSALDIGCGVGAYLEIFKRFSGTKIMGVDGIDKTASILSADEYVAMELGAINKIRGAAEVVLCMEVLEHLSGQLPEVLIKAMSACATKAVLFSAAEPGQPGNGHINCRPITEWIALWQNEGWTPDLDLTLSCRALSSLFWFRRNFIVFRRYEEEPNFYAARFLSEIGRRKFRWHPQSPGVRSYIFDAESDGEVTGYQ
jgi:glycosyltransferase involved in cell wall biosynthesis